MDNKTIKFNNEYVKQLKKIFMQNCGYATTKDIEKASINRYYIHKLFNDGYIDRIKRGVYKWNDSPLCEHSSLLEASLIVPKGVVCLLSALSYHGLTTYTPWEISIAIEKNDTKVVLPNYPPIKLYYFSEKQYKAGIKKIRQGSTSIKVYSMEKTLCDCLKYKEQVGLDIFKEGLKEYLKKPGRNIQTLMKFAEIDNVTKDMRKYLEVLV